MTVVVANALEFFDYFAFGIFATFIGASFFPSHEPSVASLAAFGTFATGFLLRPVGAVILGRYADRAGRKPALLMTASLMTLGTLSVAVIPSYSVLGSAAPLLLLACRMMQGFAIGGEMGASGALMAEHCSPGRRGFYCGWLLAGQGIALVAAGTCGLVLGDLLTSEEMANWGWRVPFLLAAVLIPLQIRLRRSLKETRAIEEEAAASEAKVNAPGRVKAIVLGMLLIMGGTVPTYVATFTAPYELAGLVPTQDESFLLTIALGAVIFAMSVAGGWLSDIYGHTSIVIWARGLSILSVFPTYAIGLSEHGGHAFMAGIVLVTASSALGAGPTIALLLAMVPERRRATSLSFIHSAGVAVFGSTAPAVVAALNGWGGVGLAAAWYIAVSGAIAICAALATRGHIGSAQRLPIRTLNQP